MTLLWLNKLAPAIAEVAARPAAAQRALQQLCTTRLASSSSEDGSTNPTPPRSPLPDVEANDALPPPPSLDALAARFGNAARLQNSESMMQRLANLNSALRRPNAPGSSAPVCSRAAHRPLLPPTPYPAQTYISATSGYAELGKTQARSRHRLSRLDYTSPDRINPYRLYFPGHSYTPEDLVNNSADQAIVEDPAKAVRYPSNKQAFWFGDFKNVEFLRLYIGDGGRVKPRRVTGLRGPAQRRVVRSINSARQLALLNPCSRHPIVDFGADMQDDDVGWSSDEDIEAEDDEEMDSAVEKYSRVGRAGYSGLAVEEEAMEVATDALSVDDDAFTQT